MKRFKGVMLGTLLVLSLTLATAWAQDAQPQTPPQSPPQSEDKPSPSIQADAPPPPPGADASSAEQANQPEPPSRVARLQYTSGSVSIQPQGTGDWAAGVINRPLTSSDNIWTDKDSRAELNVGSGLIRMGSESSLTLTSVSDNTTQLELHQGTLSLRVHNLAPGETYEIDTPNTAFTVQTAGEYRVDVDSNGNTSEVTVRRGEGQASNNGSSVAINAGQQAHFGGDPSNSDNSGEVAQAPAPDSFDNWCQGRDQRDEHSVSARYVSPDMIGSQDLDEYGTWHDTPQYGEVWTPSGVPGDWAPYHYGHWVWIAPWGWTWVDDEPWGFAPFHYGRWVYGGGYWGWAPGPYWGRPFYAPALVAWFGGRGWGGGFGFGFGGGIGWCALGWGEPFFPWYHTGFGYFNRVNIYNTRIANINGFHNGFGRPGFGAGFHYANLRAPGGTMAVPQRALTNSMQVHGMGVRMSANQFAGASLGARVPVNPSRVSRLGATAGRAAVVPPARAFSRATVSRAGAMSNSRVSSRAAESVARPNGGSMASRNAMSTSGALGRQSTSSRYVPRPPASMRSSNNGMAQSRSSSSQQMRSTPATPNRSYAAQGAGRGSSNYVPRPRGSSDYASNGYRGDYSSRGYSSPGYSSRDSYGSSRSYGDSSRYSSPSRSYSSGAPYRSYPGPAYRSYSAPPPSRGYSASTSRGNSGRSYSAPSSHGSAGGSSGGHSSGGGGGHSSGGGGGHGGGRR